MKQLEIIKKTVCQHYSLLLQDIDSKTRKREIVQARQQCHYFARTYTKHSLSVISKNIGFKDHATVLHSVRTVENLSFTDPRYASELNEVRDKVISRLNQYHEELKKGFKEPVIKRPYSQYAFDKRHGISINKLQAIR